MEIKLILDTNAYVGFKLGYSEIVEFLVRADLILLSPIVLGELIKNIHGLVYRLFSLPYLSTY